MDNKTKKKTNVSKTTKKTQKKSVTVTRTKSHTAKKSEQPNKKLIIIIAVILAAVIAIGGVIGIVIWATRDKSDSPKEDANYVYTKQEINYTESTDKINNPDQGFYRPISVRITPDQVTYNKNIVTAATQLYHLRIDISAFSGAVNGGSDLDITQTGLDGLDGLLAYLNERQKSAIVRFAYDKGYGGNANAEPSMEKLLSHIEQFSEVLNNYENVISAVEVGLFGPWGEMHTSTAANKQNISAAIHKFLNCTEGMPILVRTPKMIYDYLGITINDIDSYTIESTAKAYRLGLFNDGYLGSDTDLGTYSNREKEIPWLSKQTEHLPYGGEVVIPDSKLHDIDTCTEEMFQIHLSYLNIEWNNNVIEKWKNSTYTKKSGSESLYYGKSAFNYIENRMGYRLVVTDSTFGYAKESNDVKVELKLKNVGFGNLNRKKRITVFLVDVDNNVTQVNCGEYSGAEKIEFKLNGLDKTKEYEVYVALHGGMNEDKPTYAVQFANVEMWNESMSANLVGKIKF